jgi:HEAT repeat protein
MVQRRNAWLIAAAALAALGLGGCAPPPDGMQTDPANAVVESKIALLQTVGHDDPVVRARALEGVALFMAEDHGNLLIAALDDESPGVRTSAAMAIGDIRYQPAEPRLLEMASDNQNVGEPYLTVIPAVVYALDEFGHDEYLKLLGPLLFNPYDTIRVNTAEALGKIGDPRAIPALKSARWKERELGNQLRYDEALARLGDRASAARLEAYTKGRFLDLRVQGILSLAEQYPARARTVLGNILADEEEHPAVRLTAAGALAEMGHTSRQTYRYTAAGLRRPEALLKQAFDAAESKIAQAADARLLVQRQAAWALGYMRRYPGGVDLLVEHVEDPDPTLRLLSAISILRLLPELAPQAEAPEPARPDQSAVFGHRQPDPDQPEQMDPTAPPAPRPELETSGAKE